MSGDGGVRAWTGTRFSPVDEPVGTTLAADSWLSVDGAVLAFERHRARFADAVADAGGSRHDALAAADAVAQLVPVGRWSPRLDLTPAGIRLRLRTPPHAGGTVEVVTASRDPRTLPLRKGPDLAALGDLQAEERARVGADVEPVLTHEGLVAEGAWSALVWWRGDALHVPDAAIPRLPSVTAAVLAELARDAGVALREERARPEDLAGAEVWLANALRGIRVVSAWHGGPALAPGDTGPGSRAAAWRARLEAARTMPAGRP
ncbi:aminotransferase class IV [Agrococcus sp. SCSIO52902]|uniref:aminotransferase class IV n=1 Tax=Agrococcus sp. SCSIO52902 TaxID=2933290 RepID=UPI001FF33E86|nr:aminotransferase class IV [Agrococcus sp. SCSIO52902]UOW00655.1 aminotransferase class IV [Agrococcus sp. SCSIO52902]